MILITTPTGAIGSQVLRSLLDEAPARGEALRVVVRDPAKLPEEVRGRVDVVTGSHGDAAVLDRALDGVEAVFWVVPPDPAAASLDEAYSGFTRPAAKAFAAHGVRRVVGVSSVGRGTPVAGRAGLVTASLAMDDLIAGSGVAYRALACATFTDNLLRQAGPIRERGVFSDTVPADRPEATVATADIAAAAVRLLLDREWSGTGEVPVLGPEELTADERARILSEVLGRAVRYEPVSLEDYAAGFAARGVPEAFATGMVEMMRARNEGLDAGVSRTDANVFVGRTTFREWCEGVLRGVVAGA
ncbi:NAD(P)H-binding protein [Streptomyces griseoaurantiacus]|uniref:NAD(P)H-binding protein n=1 Tax=Streptomyces griseoaurantiacus TaxID=68213 RepID=UPI0036BBD707